MARCRVASEIQIFKIWHELDLLRIKLLMTWLISFGLNLKLCFSPRSCLISLRKLKIQSVFILPDRFDECHSQPIWFRSVSIANACISNKIMILVSIFHLIRRNVALFTRRQHSVMLKQLYQNKTSKQLHLEIQVEWERKVVSCSSAEAHSTNKHTHACTMNVLIKPITTQANPPLTMSERKCGQLLLLFFLFIFLFFSMLFPVFHSTFLFLYRVFIIICYCVLEYFFSSFFSFIQTCSLLLTISTCFFSAF